jgi:hypothetical protein
MRNIAILLSLPLFVGGCNRQTQVNDNPSQYLGVYVSEHAQYDYKIESTNGRLFSISEISKDTDDVSQRFCEYRDHCFYLLKNDNQNDPTLCFCSPNVFIMDGVRYVRKTKNN